MAQAEAIRRESISWSRSTPVPGLWLIIAMLVVWFLVAKVYAATGKAALAP